MVRGRFLESVMVSSARSRTQVALLIETSNAYSRGLLRGIRTFIREGAGWEIHCSEQGRGDVPPPWFQKWKGHGIIARIENRLIEEAVLRSGVPTVNVSAAELDQAFPTVISNSDGIARMAAEHLLERGFRNFGYCGDARFDWSFRHQANFVKHVSAAGFGVSIFDADRSDGNDWQQEQQKLGAWLNELPKPVGIFACYDIRAQQLLEACRQEALEVPDEIAVVGHHNDKLLCELCDPPLSSVIPNPRRAGYEAAVLLDKLMRGMPVPTQPKEIDPLGVAQRESTDVIAIDDKEVARAIRFIRENAVKGIGVEDVLMIVPISRTLLERRFQKFLGRSPYEEILRLRIERVKELLANTDLPIAEIADRVGFSGVEYLSAMFKKKLGVSPRAFRREASVK
jgi:LacI family transcriptional regulator